MGKIKPESQNETPTLTHFSHPHPLNHMHITDYQQISNLASSCSGCNLKPSGIIYSCTTCKFFLHKQCFEMPKKITHPFHKEHALTLLPEPTYAGGLFNCDACGENGKGFSYHCQPCGIDLHILCAVMPLSVTHASHTHKLDLTFGSPYDSNNFGCDICKSLGANNWLYRCNSCGFDAHLNCARLRQQTPARIPGQQAAMISSRPAPAPQSQGYMQQNFIPHPITNNAALGFPAGGQIVAPNGFNRQNELLLEAIIQQMANNNITMAQALMLQGGGIGGGYGGDRGIQQMMRLVSGGGGVDMLQSLLGDNGLDLLGGGGLQDIIGGALGGFGF